MSIKQLYGGVNNNQNNTNLSELSNMYKNNSIINTINPSQNDFQNLKQLYSGSNNNLRNSSNFVYYEDEDIKKSKKQKYIYPSNYKK